MKNRTQSCGRPRWKDVGTPKKTPVVLWPVWIQNWLNRTIGTHAQRTRSQRRPSKTCCVCSTHEQHLFCRLQALSSIFCRLQAPHRGPRVADLSSFFRPGLHRRGNQTNQSSRSPNRMNSRSAGCWAARGSAAMLPHRLHPRLARNRSRGRRNTH